MKVVIIRKVSEKTEQLIQRQFPEKWEIATVPLEEVTNEIKDAAKQSTSQPGKCYPHTPHGRRAGQLPFSRETIQILRAKH